MPAKKATKWDIQVVAYDSGKAPPTMTAGGKPSGQVKPEDIERLLDALGEFAQRAGAKLNALKITPSEFTIEGHVALQISAGVPPILQFGVETGLSVSMTWRFEDSTVQIAPQMRRKSPPPPVEPSKPPRR